MTAFLNAQVALVRGTWYQAPGTWYLVPSNQVPSTWHLVFGVTLPDTWYQVLGTRYRYVLLGTKYLVLGAKYFAFGTQLPRQVNFNMFKMCAIPAQDYHPRTTTPILNMLIYVISNNAFIMARQNLGHVD